MFAAGCMGGVFSLQRGARAAKRVIFNVLSGLFFWAVLQRLVQGCTLYRVVGPFKPSAAWLFPGSLPIKKIR
jgi:hypothetical protein